MCRSMTLSWRLQKVTIYLADVATLSSPFPFDVYISFAARWLWLESADLILVCLRAGLLCVHACDKERERVSMVECAQCEQTSNCFCAGQRSALSTQQNKCAPPTCLISRCCSYRSHFLNKNNLKLKFVHPSLGPFNGWAPRGASLMTKAPNARLERRLFSRKPSYIDTDKRVWWHTASARGILD